MRVCGCECRVCVGDGEGEGVGDGEGVCVRSLSPFPLLYSSPLPLVVEGVARGSTNLRPFLAPSIVSCSKKKTTQRHLPPTPQPPPRATSHSPLAGMVYWSLLSYTGYCVVHTHTHTHTHTSASSKHKSLKHMRSFSKLFRRKGSGHKKNLARRASAPVPRSGKM